MAEQPSEGDSMMTHQFLKLAAASVIVALTAVSTPVRADEMVQNLGPVGPREAILATLGSKRVIAFYVPNNGHCALHAVVWSPIDADAVERVSMQISLKPRQIIRIINAEAESLDLECGSNAANLAVVNTDQLIAFRHDD
jgi:hypothetical protein